MEIPFYQVDVFTDHIFGGNPLAVFPQSQCLQEEYLQKIAREMNLSETTFVYPSSIVEADFDVRIFTPTQELPFAGHPTLGTAYILREKGYITPNQRPIRLNFWYIALRVTPKSFASCVIDTPCSIFFKKSFLEISANLFFTLVISIKIFYRFLLVQSTHKVHINLHCKLIG